MFDLLAGDFTCMSAFFIPTNIHISIQCSLLNNIVVKIVYRRSIVSRIGTNKFPYYNKLQYAEFHLSMDIFHV